MDDGSVYTKCDQCQDMYNARIPPENPPCDKCFVELRKENEDAARIFNIVRGQVLTRHNGAHDVIIGLNHMAVWAAIDEYGIKDRIGTFERVNRLFHALNKKEEKSSGQEITYRH